MFYKNKENGGENTLLYYMRTIDVLTGGVEMPQHKEEGKERKTKNEEE